MRITKDQLGRVGEVLAHFLEQHKNSGKATVLTLAGDLGAGKTTFVQHVAAAFGVEESVVSPTFIIVRAHQTKKGGFSRMIHIDAYRLENKEELSPLKLEAVFNDKDALVCIEWPEKLFGTVPEGAIEVTLATIGEEVRELTTKNKELEDYLQLELEVV